MRRVVTMALACAVFAGGVSLGAAATRAATITAVAPVDGAGAPLLATSPSAQGGEHKGIAWGFKKPTADDPRTGALAGQINGGVDVDAHVSA